MDKNRQESERISKDQPLNRKVWIEESILDKRPVDKRRLTRELGMLCRSLSSLSILSSLNCSTAWKRIEQPGTVRNRVELDRTGYGRS